jgi:pyrimidine operon attenuation protein/uracil phosphoribosyltransferase
VRAGADATLIVGGSTSILRPEPAVEPPQTLPPGMRRVVPTRWKTAHVPTDPTTTTTVLDAKAITSVIDRLVKEIGTAVPADRRLVLVGIRRRGDVLARRIAEELSTPDRPVPTGSLDITLYRDDFAQIGALPMIGISDIGEDITDAHVIIVDDVLYTGRTIRAALNELADFGRAAQVELCVLVDRGGRQLPIQPDYSGQVLQAPEGAQVSVRVADVDGDWGVDLVELGAPA